MKLMISFSTLESEHDNALSKMFSSTKNKRIFLTGFTLIEVLVGISLTLIVFLGIFGAYQLALKVIIQTRNKVVATAIASGEIEKIRNLPYSSVGISNGFPSGDLVASSIVRQNNANYTVERTVDYVVDIIDGIVSPDDDCPNDYKKVGIKVSWTGRFIGQVVLATDVSPASLAEECSETGGILEVLVFDATGLMVPSPLIEIKNPVTNETVITATPLSGKHYFSLSPATYYKVVISKTDYSAERTYGSGEIYNSKTIITPENPHPIVLEGQLTEISFSIDKLSSMTIATRGTKGAGYPVVHNVTFTLTGAKKVGLDANENPIYKYSQNHNANGSGQVEIPNLEWDSYSFSVLTPGLDLVGIESPPGTETAQPVGLPPNTYLNVRLIVKAENTLLVIVQNIATGEPVFSATVRLSNSQLGYDAILYTNESGQAYFIPLQAATYDLEIQAPGYLTTTTQVLVSGDQIKIIRLEQIE